MAAHSAAERPAKLPRALYLLLKEHCSITSRHSPACFSQTMTPRVRGGGGGVAAPQVGLRVVVEPRERLFLVRPRVHGQGAAARGDVLARHPGPDDVVMNRLSANWLLGGNCEVSVFQPGPVRLEKPSFGPALVYKLTGGEAGSNAFDLHWCYWLAPIAGAIVAALIYENLILGNDGES